MCSDIRSYSQIDPEILYAEYCFEEKINIHECNLKTSKAIAKLLNALMNTSGGLILLHCGELPQNIDKKRDRWLQAFQQHVTTHWIPGDLYMSLVHVQYKELLNLLYIVLIVDKSSELVTFSYNAYGRHAVGVMPITGAVKVKEMIQRTEEDYLQTVPRSTLKDRAFTLDEKLPAHYRESQTMEFKHYEGSNDFSAQKIKRKLENKKSRGLWENISAFANTGGGSLVIGIKEEKTGPVVKGYQVSDNQHAEEDELTQYIDTKLKKCVWNGKQPDHPTYWNVSYHDVKSDEQRDRKLIEVSVVQVRGGMFYKAPVYYRVDGDARDKQNRLVEVSEFDTWKRAFYPNWKKSESWSKMDRLDKHVDKENNSGRSETEPVKDIKGQAESNRINENDEEENMGAFSQNAKTHKSFRESQSEHKTDIRPQKLSVHSCCIQDMVRQLQSLKGRHRWFPSLKSTLMRTRLPDNCEKLFAHIDHQDWEGIASVIGVQSKFRTGIPKSLCDVLVISEHGSPKLICCFKNEDIPEADKIGYTLQFGRELKAKFLMSTFNTAYLPLHFHFDVQVLTLSRDGSVSITWNSPDEQHKQLVTYPEKAGQHQYQVACTGLAEMLLQTDRSLTNYRGDVLMKHLTAEQARIILERDEKILIVFGKSGTGKTAVALTMIKEAKADAPRNILYICASAGVQAYVESQRLCPVWKITRTNCLSRDQKSDLKTYNLVVVDDAHAIVPGDDWEKDPDDLYNLLFSQSTNTDAEVAIFLDPYQDYKGQMPKEFHEKLRDLALSSIKPKLETDQIQIYPLKKRIRNSHQINSWIQANQNKADKQKQRNCSESVPCLNETEGDDIKYSYVGSSLDEIGSAVDAILHRLEKLYGKSSIVILCDDEQQLNDVRNQLQNKFNRQIQNGRIYPITEIVMCQLEDFGGLEAEVVLFLLPPKWGLEYVGNTKYVCCVSSRAISRLEFLLPWNPMEYQDRLEKLEEFLELFKIVSVKIFICCKDCKD